MKKVKIFAIILIIIIITILSYYFILLPKTTHKTKTISAKVVSSIENFKKNCSGDNKEYIEKTNYGIALCGENKSEDANRLCKSDNKIDTCYFCKYGSFCEQNNENINSTSCYCSNYERELILMPEGTDISNQ